ncbi:MAG: hypothetical protein RL708_353 [Bacteroidota bacterium]|jgi:hypothetical protein
MGNNEKISGLQKIFLSQFQQSATNIELLNSEKFWADFYELLTNPNDNSDEIVSFLNKLGIADIDAVYNQCIAFKENHLRNNDSQFEKDAKSAFTISERKSLKEKLALTDELLQFELTDQEIISAFNIQKKNEQIEWKKKFAEWDKETVTEKANQKGKVISFAFIKYAVAACVIGALVWVGIEVNKNNTTNFANNKIDTTHQIIKSIEKPQFANAVVIKSSRNIIQEQNIGYAPTAAKEIKIEVIELQNRILSMEKYFSNQLQGRVGAPAGEGLFSYELKKEIDSLKSINNTYLFDGNHLQLFTENDFTNKIQVLKTNSNQYYLKENKAYFEIIKTAKNIPLIPVTDKAIINKIERIEFDNEK